MKKLIITLLLGCSGLLSADVATVTRSSFIAGNESTKYISSSTYLDSVIIGAASTNGVLTIFDSTSTTGASAAVVVASVSLATVGERHFGGSIFKGITYTTVSNSNGVTIIWRR